MSATTRNEKSAADDQAAALTDSERQLLTFALGLAADEMASRGDEFTADDEAALNRFRRMTAAPIDRAAMLREVADDWTAHCPDHSDAEEVFMDCPCDWTHELRRKADEVEAQQPEPWLSDSARIGRTLIWSWSEIGKGAYGQGYRDAQTQARTLLGGQADEAQQAETGSRIPLPGIPECGADCPCRRDTREEPQL